MWSWPVWVFRGAKVVELPSAASLRSQDQPDWCSELCRAEVKCGGRGLLRTGRRIRVVFGAMLCGGVATAESDVDGRGCGRNERDGMRTMPECRTTGSEAGGAAGRLACPSSRPIGRRARWRRQSVQQCAATFSQSTVEADKTGQQMAGEMEQQ